MATVHNFKLKPLAFLFACLFPLLPLSAQTQLGADIDGEAADDNSGYSVSLSANGSRVAIGAVNNDGNGIGSGHTRIYQWNGTAWVQLGADIDGEAAFDQSGTSVSLSADGSRVAIGAIQNDGNGSNSGHTRIYEWNGTAWVQLGTDINGEAAFDGAGLSVSLSADGSRLVIGAAGNDGGGFNSGHARIYQWNGSAWVQLGTDINAEAAGDQAGQSVSLSADGSRVAIGANFNDGNGSDAGHTRIFQWNGTAWMQLGADIDGEVVGDGSGRSVFLSANGNRVAVGAPFNDGNGNDSGHARVYQWNGTAWVQFGADINGEAAGNQSGSSVSLSSDGNLIAIGARLNSGNGISRGHTRIYEWNGMAWVQHGADINGEGADDQAGFSVSLSADGSRLAIGARHNDGNGINAGHTRVYQLSTPLPVELISFNGSRQGNANRLDWTTGTEKDMSLYQIERSGNGLEFEAIGSVAAVGNSLSPLSYTYLDAAPLAGDSYYRLRMEETTGIFSYSPVIVLSRSQATTYSLFPNPVSSTLTYQFSTEQAESISLELTDVLGRVVLSEVRNAAVGLNSFDLNTAELPAGTYFFGARHSDSGVEVTEKMVKIAE